MSSAKRRFLESGWRCLATALFLILLAVSFRANAALEEIRDFHLVSCGKRMCYELKTSYAERGLLGRFYYFEASRLRIWAVDPKKAERVPGSGGRAQGFTARDGYYDPSTDLLVVRGIVDSRVREVVIDLQEETEVYYK